MGHKKFRRGRPGVPIKCCVSVGGTGQLMSGGNGWRIVAGVKGYSVVQANARTSGKALLQDLKKLMTMKSNFPLGALRTGSWEVMRRNGCDSPPISTRKFLCLSRSGMSRVGQVNQEFFSTLWHPLEELVHNSLSLFLPFSYIFLVMSYAGCFLAIYSKVCL